MELTREFAPFLLGVVVPPIVMIAVRGGWAGGTKFTLTFVTALVLGAGVSFFAGELASGLPTALIAVMIDTSLVYTGSQLAYWSFWRPVLEPRLHSEPALAKRRVRH